MENGKVEMKLEDFMDLMEAKKTSDYESGELYEILTMLFDSARLSYDDKTLYFDADTILNGYLKGREKNRYNATLKRLQEEKAQKSKEIKEEKE